MHDTCAIHGIRILITNPPKLDNKPHVTRLNGGLRPLSRPLIRSSRGRSGALVGWDGCEVRLCVRVPVCVPAPPGVFLPVLYCTQFHSFPNSLKPRRGSHFSKGVITDAWQKDPGQPSANPRPSCSGSHRQTRAVSHVCQTQNTLVPYCLPSTVVGNGCTSWGTLRFEVFTWRYTSTSLGDSIISQLV